MGEEGKEEQGREESEEVAQQGQHRVDAGPVFAFALFPCAWEGVPPPPLSTAHLTPPLTPTHSVVLESHRPHALYPKASQAA